MKTKVANNEELEKSTNKKRESREEITLTVFAIFFIITVGMLYLTS